MINETELDELRRDEDNEQPHPCDEPGCERLGMACWLPNLEGPSVMDEPFGFYCSEHAGKNGFCWSCGQFWAGVEDFDLDPRGLCSNCRDEYTDDEEDEEDFDAFDYYDLP